MVARFVERVRLKQLFGTFAESGVMNNDRLFQFSATFFIILRAGNVLLSHSDILARLRLRRKGRYG